MRQTAFVPLMLGVALVSGCSSMSGVTNTFFHDQSITNIVGEVWEVRTTRPVPVRASTITDFLMERASHHCEARKLVMLPIRGHVKDDGTEGRLEFRCQQPLNYQSEYKGLSAIFNIGDDEDDKKAKR